MNNQFAEPAITEARSRINRLPDEDRQRLNKMANEIEANVLDLKKFRQSWAGRKAAFRTASRIATSEPKASQIERPRK